MSDLASEIIVIGGGIARRIDVGSQEPDGIALITLDSAIWQLPA
jgi:hypothetical protein